MICSTSKVFPNFTYFKPSSWSDLVEWIVPVSIIVGIWDRSLNTFVEATEVLSKPLFSLSNKCVSSNVSINQQNNCWDARECTRAKADQSIHTKHNTSGIWLSNLNTKSRVENVLHQSQQIEYSNKHRNVVTMNWSNNIQKHLEENDRGSCQLECKILRLFKGSLSPANHWELLNRSEFNLIWHFLIS